jgi:hypothetical protein
MDNIRICNHCHKSQSIDQFQGVKGEVSTCLRCRKAQKCRCGVRRGDCNKCSKSLLKENQAPYIKEILEQSEKPFKSCSTCKHLFALDQFIGVNGNEVKMCLTCRNKNKIAKHNAYIHHKNDPIYFMDIVDGVEITFKKCHDCKKLQRLDQYQGVNGEIVKCLTCRTKSKCVHGHRRLDCELCGGSLRCVHGKRKYTCSICYNKLRCPHGKLDHTCHLCHEEKRCSHNRNISKCTTCNPKLLCIHGVGKYGCIVCNPSILCQHKTRKTRCKFCDPIGHLKHTVRVRIRHALGTKKSKHTIEYLGCSADFLKKYLEEQFKPGMTIENHGEWHIDHILPLTPTDPISEDELIKRLHFTNLQPLWAQENLSKGNKDP